MRRSKESSRKKKRCLIKRKKSMLRKDGRKMPRSDKNQGKGSKRVNEQ